MSYNIIFTKAAAKELEQIPKTYYNKIKGRILKLADNPRPAGSIKLKGSENLYRIRVGTYRVVYCIADKIITVTITRIAHRKEVYD